jgi:hypothetical protein
MEEIKTSNVGFSLFQQNSMDDFFSIISTKCQGNNIL